MTLAELEFDISIREWAVNEGLVLKPSTDHKIVIQYVDSNTLSAWNDQDLESAKNKIISGIGSISNQYHIEYDINFTSLDTGNLVAEISIKSSLIRKEAACRYYDLLKLGYQMTPEQFHELQSLRKKFGFI